MGVLDGFVRAYIKGLLDNVMKMKDNAFGLLDTLEP